MQLPQNYQIKLGVQNLQKTHTIKVIDDGESKFEGLSIINLWLKKILLDVIDNKIVSTDVRIVEWSLMMKISQV